MDYKKFVSEALKEEQSGEHLKRLLREAVSFHINEVLSSEQREDQNLPDLFVGHEIESIAILVRHIHKKLREMDKKKRMADPELYDLYEMTKRVNRMKDFSFMLHKVSKRSLKKVDPHPYSEQALKVIEFLETKPELHNIYKRIEQLSNERDDKVLTHLNNTMSIGDNDELKETLNELDFITKKIKEAAETLMREVDNKDSSKVSENTSFWNDLTQARVSERF